MLPQARHSIREFPRSNRVDFNQFTSHEILRNRVVGFGNSGPI
jgi:hypothetical protein